MKYLIITLSLILLTSCQTTNLEKAQTFKAAIIVDKDYDKIYEIVSKMDLTNDQVASVNTIDSAKQALDLILDGSNLLGRFEAASLLERHYAAAKTAYLQLKGSVKLDSLTPLQLYDLERFDQSVIILDRRVSEIADNQDIQNRKTLAYEVLEMLITTLQIAELLE